MRDWLLVLVPVGVVVYFLAYPSEFTKFLGWVSTLFR
jgi:hypothetical protein